MDADSDQGDAYLGSDAGSTTTKLVLISPDGGLLYSYYASNEGNPVSVVLGQLREIYRRFGDRIVIRGSASTGYGEDLVKSAFHIDRGLVETVAHYRAARHFNPGAAPSTASCSTRPVLPAAGLSSRRLPKRSATISPLSRSSA